MLIFDEKLNEIKPYKKNPRLQGKEPRKMPTKRTPAAKKTATTTKKTKAKKPDLNDVAFELIKLAEQGGVEQNFFFTTTFARYKTQLNLLARLQAEISGTDLMVTKEYVRGRQNLVSNPVITEYNKTSQAANQTVICLMKIISTFSKNSLSANAVSAGDTDEL